MYIYIYVYTCITNIYIYIYIYTTFEADLSPKNVFHGALHSNDDSKSAAAKYKTCVFI